MSGTQMDEVLVLCCTEEVGHVGYSAPLAPATGMFSKNSH